MVLLSNDTGVDVSKAQRELKKRLKLPGAVFVEPELPHELASALQRYPYDRSPKMSETIQSALDAASVDGVLFVALSTTDSHKDLAVWIWRVERQKISRVHMPGLDRSVFEVLDTATRVVNLRWNETELQQPADTERPGTDLFVNVHVPFRGKGDHLWRWSEADETLYRVQDGR